MGSLIDRRYSVIREIARGGMCSVHAAEHMHTGRRVAIKRLHPQIDDPAMEQRLLMEARALETCRGPHVVEVLDAGIDERPYVVLEMLDGRGLDSLLTTRQRIGVVDACTVVLELLDALETVHARGLVHRDVKPSNVFICREGEHGERSKLIDFGVARLPSAPHAPALTQAGERLGTFEYMAPEQLLGEVVGHTADLYAAAVVLYEAITGELPYKGGPRDLMMALAARTPPPRISSLAPAVPPGLDAVLMRALGHEPAQRFASASDFASAIRHSVGVGDRITSSLLEAPKPAPAKHERGHARAPYVTPVRVIADGVTVDGHAADVSEGGLLVMLAAEIPADRAAQVRFCLPVSGRAVTVEATVRWRKDARAHRAVGLQFTALPDEARADIRRFVSIAGLA